MHLITGTVKILQCHSLSQMLQTLLLYGLKVIHCNPFFMKSVSWSFGMILVGKIYEIGSTGISSIGGHTEKRTHCVNRFVAEFGRMPLVYTSMKAVNSRSLWFWWLFFLFHCGYCCSSLSSLVYDVPYCNCCNITVRKETRFMLSKNELYIYIFVYWSLHVSKNFSSVTISVDSVFYFSLCQCRDTKLLQNSPRKVFAASRLG